MPFSNYKSPSSVLKKFNIEYTLENYIDPNSIDSQFSVPPSFQEELDILFSDFFCFCKLYRFYPNLRYNYIDLKTRKVPSIVTAILPRNLTLEEFLKLPETQPASEWVDGCISQKQMPQGKHARLQLKFCDTVNRVAEETQIALAFPELRCTFGDRSIVPDASVFTWDRIPFEPDGEVPNIFNLSPDWVVEILSPDQRATKVIRNLLHCLKHGTQLGWLIDPEERLVLAFTPGKEPVEFIGNDALPMPSFLTLDLTVDRVFSWLKPGGSRSAAAGNT